MQASLTISSMHPLAVPLPAAAEGSPLSPQHQREVDGGDAFEACVSALYEVFPEAAARPAGMSEAAAVEQHLQADRQRRQQVRRPPLSPTCGPSVPACLPACLSD